MNKKFAIVYDNKSNYCASDYPEDYFGQCDSYETINRIKQIMESSFSKSSVEVINGCKELIERLSTGNRYDFVFNTCAGLNGDAHEAQVASILEVYNVPYTFSNPTTLAICQNKSHTKKIAKQLGFNVSEDILIYSKEDISYDFLKKHSKVFVKPNSLGDSIGIDDSAIISSYEKMHERIINLKKEYNIPVLVEKYLPGKEFSVGVLQLKGCYRVIGYMSIEILDNSESYSYKNKNCTQSVKYHFLEEKLFKELKNKIITFCKYLNIRDAARFDFKYDEAGKANLIEVNALPGLHPVRSDLYMMARNKNIKYADFILNIINSSIYNSKEFNYA